MTRSHSVTSTVEVGVDPSTAFTVFTDEIDCWWIQGAINFYDSSQAYGKRIEPGVGGRVVEVYDDATGEGLELARITGWKPGSRLAWRSSVDDVEIEVRFDACGAGTIVSVQATIPEGGADRGGTSWLRMTPIWFGDWMTRRDDVPHAPLRLARLAIALYYEKPAAAAQWLHDVFGLQPAAGIPDTEPPDDHVWIEFHVGASPIIIFKQTGTASGDDVVTHAPWVFVDDLDAHYAHARDSGARIVQEIWQHGPRAYEAADLEGHHWTFAQAGPLMRAAPLRTV